MDFALDVIGEDLKTVMIDDGEAKRMKGLLKRYRSSTSAICVFGERTQLLKRTARKATIHALLAGHHRENAY